MAAKHSPTARGCLLTCGVCLAASCILLGPGHRSALGADESAPLENTFLAAFQAERYNDALAVADRQLAGDPDDGLALMYRGTCLVMLERYAEAVEAFRASEAASSSLLTDRTGLYLRALALYHIKAYGRSQEELDRLARTFPKSRLAEHAERLALKVEKRLAQGLEPGNLNWYLDAGLKAYDSGRPALAAEYLEELLLLAARFEFNDFLADPRPRMALAGCYLELGSADRALSRLAGVDLGHSEYRAGLFKAMALKAAGRDPEALAILETVAAESQSEPVKTRALQYLGQWRKDKGHDR